MAGINAPDLRYDPFTDTFTAYGHGYSGNPVEVHTVPSSAPYFVFLNEIPRKDSPSTLTIVEQGGPSFTEVSYTTSPGSGQFRAVYGGDGTTAESTVGQGTLEFNSADAGKKIEVSYYGLGAIMQNQFLNQMLEGFYGEGTFKGDIDTKLRLIGKQGSSTALGNAPGNNQWITGMRYDRVAVGLEDLDALRMYQTNGNTFSLVGNPFSITGLSFAAITTLSETSIAMVSIVSGVQYLSKYDHDGTDWSLVGNQLTLSGTNSVSIKALSDSRIALYMNGTKHLRTYDFAGSDWSQTGNSFSITTTATSITICELTDDSIVLFDYDNNTMTAYEFDETDWSQKGSQKSYTMSIQSIGSNIGSDRFIFFDPTTDTNVYLFDFSSEVFLVETTALSLPSVTFPAIATLSNVALAIGDGTDDTLEIYYGIYENKEHPSPAL